MTHTAVLDRCYNIRREPECEVITDYSICAIHVHLLLIIPAKLLIDKCPATVSHLVLSLFSITLHVNNELYGQSLMYTL